MEGRFLVNEGTQSNVVKRNGDGEFGKRAEPMWKIGMQHPSPTWI